MKLSFLGAAGSVTGSKYLVEADGARVLVDCGLFQGPKPLRQRNWEPFPFDPSSVQSVILTHAHLDHTGALPLLVKSGFQGQIYSSWATQDVSGIILPDSGHIQEEDARHANRGRYSKHDPALPLYTEADAHAALRHFTLALPGVWTDLPGGFSFKLVPSGHLLGACSVYLRHGPTTIAFSGDLGRTEDLILRPPEPFEGADYLVVESTYGNRRHSDEDAGEELARVVGRTAQAGGVVLVPSFGVGRAQTLLRLLSILAAEKRVPRLPVFLDSPMATKATHIFCAHLRQHKLSPEECHALCETPRYIGSADESAALDERIGPFVLISASGMATGGRVLHHLKAFAPDGKNAIVFAGYQAVATRGRSIVDGAKSVRIHGRDVPIRAKVSMLHSLSGHADYTEILAWMGQPATPPRAVFITHGEDAPRAAMKDRIAEARSWRCVLPGHGDSVEL